MNGQPIHLTKGQAWHGTEKVRGVVGRLRSRIERASVKRTGIVDQDLATLILCWLQSVVIDYVEDTMSVRRSVSSEVAVR